MADDVVTRQPRVEALEAALVKSWEHMDGDLTRCGVCGVSEYGLWLHPELHEPDCVIPTIAGALPIDKRPRVDPATMIVSMCYHATLLGGPCTHTVAPGGIVACGHSAGKHGVDDAGVAYCSKCAEYDDEDAGTERGYSLHAYMPTVLARCEHPRLSHRALTDGRVACGLCPTIPDVPADEQPWMHAFEPPR